MKKEEDKMKKNKAFILILVSVQNEKGYGLHVMMGWCCTLRPLPHTNYKYDIDPWSTQNQGILS